MRQLEITLKATADPTRTRILKILERGALCVCQIQAVLALAPSTVSRHLSVLKMAGLVTDRRAGKWIHYELSDGTGNPYAPQMLGILKGPLDRDPRILADRRRLREVCSIPVEKLCGYAPDAELVPGGSAARSGVPAKVRK
jgi:DNA-binding transcriptional ArsR family regulator